MKPGTRNIIIGLLAALVLFLAAATPFVFWVVLPFYLETRVLPKILQDAALPPMQATIEKIGFQEAEITDLKPKRANAFPLAADRITIHYSPSSLIEKKFSEIVVTGLRVQVSRQQGKLSFNWPGAKKSPADRSKATFEIPDTLPVNRIEFQQSQVEIQQKDLPLVVPFSGVLQAPPDSGGRMLTMFHLHLMGQPIHIAAEKPAGRQHLILSLTASDFYPAAIAPLFPGVPFPETSGAVNISATAQIDTAPPHIRNVSAIITSPRLYAHLLPKHGRAPIAAAGMDKGKIRIESADGTNWKLSAANLRLDSPHPFSLQNISAHLSLRDDAVQLQGQFYGSLQLPAGVAPASAEPAGMSIGGTFSLRRDPSGNLQFSFSGPNSSETKRKPSIRLVHKDTEAVFQPPEIQARGSWAENTSNVEWRIRVPAGGVASPAGRIDVRRMQISGSLTASPDRKPPVQIDWQLRTGPVSFHSPDARFDIPAVTIQGRAEKDRGRSPRVSGDLKWDNAVFKGPALPVAVHGISARIPFVWPPGKSAAGRIQTDSIRWQNRDLGSVRTTLQQQGYRAVFSGDIQNRILPAADMTFDGCIEFHPDRRLAAALNARLDADYSDRPAPLGRWFPAIKNITIQGRATARGRMERSEGKWSGTGNLQLENGQVSATENKLAIEGIRLDLSASHLLQGRTDPSQQIQFSRADIGSLQFTNGQIAYQTTADGATLIEDARWKWCGGTMHAKSFWIKPGQENYRVDLYADRLNLVQILNQLGATEAQGEGTVSGVIPIRMERGKLHIDDGFLYSTPGVGGTIRLTQAQKFISNVAGETVSLGQVALATEALKDYDYRWVTLRMLSQGEDMQLQLQFDGKPTQPLPFVYDEEIGGFARVKAGSPGSIFQGIRLDINFYLPLNQLLQYRGLLEMME